MTGVGELPVLYSVRGWTEDVNPAYIAFIEQMRSTGVEVVDIFPDHNGCATFGEWAQRATDAIVQRHRSGEPLHLLGYCGGGTVLHESVRQLEALDRPPAYLGFVDVRGGNPKDRLRFGLDSLYRVGLTRRIRFQLVRLTPPDREPASSVLWSVLRRSVRSVREFRSRGWRSNARIMPAIQAQGVLAANWESRSITTPAYAYNCPRAIDRYWPGDPSLGRAGLLLGGFVIRFIDGSHESCIEPPFSAALVERITADRVKASRIASD